MHCVTIIAIILSTKPRYPENERLKPNNYLRDITLQLYDAKQTETKFLHGLTPCTIVDKFQCFT
jgi:hypothetical protein